MLAGVPLVLLWVLVGWPLCLITGESNLYLLSGVPLTALFQRFVRKRPLRDLWVTSRVGEADVPARGGSALPLVLGVMVVPLAGLVYAAARQQPVSVIYCLAACFGAVPLAYAIRRVHAAEVCALLRHAAVPAAVGLCLVAVGRLVFGGVDQSASRALLVWLGSFATYVPALFVLEEPFFRGALDGHVSRPRPSPLAGSPRDRWPTALYVAILWGLWSLPTVPVGHIRDVDRFFAALAWTFVTHVAVGVPLSLARRRTGHLLAPVLAHAFVDAARVALGISS
jgi:membrane protease YdiL (CAAX protease family)